MSLVVLGAGSWGTTIASLVSARTPTTLWARSESVAAEIRDRRTNASYLGDFPLSDRLRATSSLDDALNGAELIVIALPSHGVRAVLSETAWAVPEGVPVLSLSKGLEQGTMARISQIVDACWPGHPVGVLTGPNLAAEVCEGQPTASVIAFADEDLAAEIRDLFATETLRLYTNPDVTGCEIAGAVKNVLADRERDVGRPRVRRQYAGRPHHSLARRTHPSRSRHRRGASHLRGTGRSGRSGRDVYQREEQEFLGRRRARAG